MDEQWIEVESISPSNIGVKVWVYPVDDDVALATYLGEGMYEVDNIGMYGTNFTHWMLTNVPKSPIK